MLRFLLLSSLLGTTALTACGDSATTTDDCSGDSCDQAAALQLCAAVRGNGERISAHFASLARIVEHYGPIDAASGGSSASISLFLTESMQLNPQTRDCDGRPCDEAETAARTALLLKSFPGYVQHLSTTEEAAAFGELLPVIQRIQSAGLDGLLDEDVDAGVAALSNLLESEDLQDLINPELITLLSTSPNPEKHARDILAGVEALGSFSADSDRIFIHPGLLNFEALADKVGRVGDFYAGYGPSDPDSMEIFMDNCASESLGLNWFQAASLPAGATTCGGLLSDMIGAYRAARAADPNSYVSRIDEQIGASMSALVSTSVLDGDTAESFAKAREDYNAGLEYTFETDFDDVAFGYWGKKSDLDTVGRNSEKFEDLKTAKFTSLGSATWRTALSYSPAEPGLARGLELGDGRISAGGWSDLHPVLALRNLGCENIVYVTRTADHDSAFSQGVAGLLGMNADEQDELYNLDSDSSYALSLTETDATWCTDWDSQPGTDLLAITLDSYNAPLESQSPFFTEAKSAYGNVTPATDLRGCTAGAKLPSAE